MGAESLGDVGAWGASSTIRSEQRIYNVLPDIDTRDVLFRCTCCARLQSSRENKILIGNIRELPQGSRYSGAHLGVSKKILIQSLHS